VLPGPTAVATAYVASGCVDGAFSFGGFFPRKAAARVALLEQLRSIDAALIFYESPNRLVDALGSIESILPACTLAVCRELTKLHEEVVRGPVSSVRAAFEARASVKGEIVLVIDAPNEGEKAVSDARSAADAASRASELLEQGVRPKQIARQIADEFGISRNEAYEIALNARA